MSSRSKKKGQRKRKSAGVCDIFEVGEKDLSPEPEECDNTEPEAKVLKTRDSDVSESRKNNDQHLNDEQQKISKNNENKTVLKDKVDLIIDLDADASENDDVLVVEDSPKREISKDSNDDNPAKCVVKTKTDKTNTTALAIVSNDSGEENAEAADNETNKTIAMHNSEKLCTVLGNQKNMQDDEVLMVCDNNIDLSKDAISLHSLQRGLQFIHNDTLEDGEVNDNTLEKPDTSEVTLNPVITIKFSNESVANIYRQKFCKFIQSFIELTVQNVDDTTISVFQDINLDPKEWVVLDETIYINEEKEEELAKLLPATPKVESPKKKKRKKKQQEPEMFVVDINPGAGAHVLTKYATKFLINDEKNEQEKNSISKPSFGSVCFNCDKDHALKDCPHPKNFGKISANRQKFQNKNKSMRYHLEEDQKYAHLRPGKVSPDLRKALRLKKHQIPSYVYQMRKLGYPPGWLEEAKLVCSELTMFDIDGKNVKDTNTKKTNGLDPDKVVDYPGFNVPFEKDFKDEFKYHHVPPYGDTFSKENMIEVFRKLSQLDEDNLETEDMELDNANECLNDDIADEDATKLEGKQLDFSMDSDSNNTRISLQELQKQKDSLLEEIKKSGETLPWEQPSEETSRSSAEEKLKKDDSNDEKEDSEGDIIKEVIIKSESEETRIEVEISEASELNDSSSSLNTSSNVNCVKHSIFGTPILKSASPFNRLPEADNFTKGVSPVIDFENLPDSTGKYEQLMTGVLQKVRNTMKRLNKPNT